MATTAQDPPTSSLSASNPSTSPPKTQTRTITIRHPPHTYLHLSLLSSSTVIPNPTIKPPAIDILTCRAHLTSALQQYLGLTGTAIPIDILKVEERDCWIRVPREDGAAVVGALGQWIGNVDGGVAWRIRGRGEWLGLVKGGGGESLFEP